MTIIGGLPTEAARQILQIELDAIESYFTDAQSDLHVLVICRIARFDYEFEKISKGQLSEIQSILKDAESLSMTIQSKWRSITQLYEKADQLNVLNEYDERIMEISELFADLLMNAFAAVSAVKKAIARFSCSHCCSVNIVNDGEGDLVCLDCGAARCI